MELLRMPDDEVTQDEDAVSEHEQDEEIDFTGLRRRRADQRPARFE
jgi:hypothetical protein